MLRLSCVLVLLCSGVLLSGCGFTRPVKGDGKISWGLEVTWHGHSCFTLEDSKGRRVVLDPFDDTVGYDQIFLKADALLVTHGHFDHNFKRAVRARRRNIDLVFSTGSHPVAGQMNITGFPSYHDNESGQIHGENIIYRFKMGGLVVAFLGDLGQDDLTPYQISELASVDVLFIPVGGVTTIGPKKAKKIVDTLKPKFIFPMHYGDIRFHKLADVTKFTKLFSADHTTVVGDSKVRIKLAEATETGQVFILKPTPKNYRPLFR